MAKRKKAKDPFAMGFKLSGKSFSFNHLPIPVNRAIEILDGLSFKELLTSRQLADRVGVQKTSFSHYVCHPALSSYKYAEGPQSRGNLWGSQRTMRELQRQLEKA
jgi:hypothetical protein